MPCFWNRNASSLARSSHCGAMVRVASILLAVATGALNFTGRDTEADVFGANLNVVFCDPAFLVIGAANATCVPNAAGVANGSNPFYVTRVSSTAPLQGIAFKWSPNLVAAGGANVGSLVGEVDLQSSTSVDLALLPTWNIKPLTGAPPNCGDPGTAVLGASSPLYAAKIAPLVNSAMTFAAFDPSKYVESFDDDDGDLAEYAAGVDGGDGGDTLPQTQADNRNSNGALIPDGVPDGANLMPDFIPRFLNATGVAPLLIARSYGILTGPLDLRLDINVLTFNFVGVGGGYGSIVLLGAPSARLDPNPAAYNPASTPQALFRCGPLVVNVTAYGVSQPNNVAIPPVAGGAIQRTLNNAVPGPGVNNNIDYFMKIASVWDYDNDTVVAPKDRCNVDPAAKEVDPADGDMVNGTCDIAPATVDNCPAGAVVCGAALASAEGVPGGNACTGLAPVNGFEGIPPVAEILFPWDLDQDVDCDGAANFSDNCPTAFNPSQRDTDADTVGDVCDPLVALGNACGGVPKPAVAIPPCHVPNGTMFVADCVDPVTIDGAGDPDGDPVACPNAPDSNGDGVDDDNPSAPNPGGAVPGEKDLNSDTDFDGVSDGEEADGDGNCDGDTLNSDTNANGTLDGAELGPGAVPCWIYDSNTNSSTSLNPNANGSPDSDNDGCSNREEYASGRNGLWPYDFIDIPGPATQTGTDGKLYFRPSATRSKSIALADASVALAYVGRTSVNAGAAYYNGDWNNDGIRDGYQIDRTAAGGGYLANPPNNAITLADVSVILGQISLPGNNCVGPP